MNYICPYRSQQGHNMQKRSFSTIRSGGKGKDVPSI
jgi:hypothetical protein